MNTDKISKYISKKRKEKGLTQQELADMTHLSEKTISKWETGRGIPDIGNLQNLAKALDTSVIELLNGEESTKEEKVIDYIKYKDKKDRRILIYVILSALVIIALLITNQILTYRNFYKTNYDKTQVTKLYGSGELFDVNDMLVITSPEKTIMVTGKIESKNQEIKDENITGYSIDSEKRHIASESGSQNLLKPRVLEEPNGYNELFTEEDISNLDKWSITIYYKKDKKELSEEIKLTPEQILSTDKYEREEIEPIARPEDQSEEIDYEELINKLKESGFEQKGTKMYELVTKEYSILFMLDSNDIDIIKGTDRIYAKGFINNTGRNGIITFNNSSKNVFEVKDGNVNCHYNSTCEEKYEKEAKEVYKIIKEYFE